MSKRFLGLSLMVVGALLVVLAVVLAMTGSSDGELAAVPSTTTAGSESTAATTTSIEPATPTSRIPAGSVPTTTVTTQPPETVADFVDSFAAALAGGDFDFVMGRLHPDIVSSYPAGVCEAWVSNEVMALSDYRIIGDATGPADETVTIGEEQISISDVYSVPVAFTFGGEDFESSADFALIDGVVYWLGMCQ